MSGGPFHPSTTTSHSHLYHPLQTHLTPIIIMSNVCLPLRMLCEPELG